MKHMLLLAAVLIVGCQSKPPPPLDPGRRVSWSEFQSLDAEQKEDPYIVDNLDEEAKQKHAAWKRNRKR